MRASTVRDGGYGGGFSDPRHALTQTFNGILIRPPTTSSPAQPRRNSSAKSGGRATPMQQSGGGRAQPSPVRKLVLSTPNGGDPSAVYAALQGRMQAHRQAQQHQGLQGRQQQRPQPAAAAADGWGPMSSNGSELSGWAEDPAAPAAAAAAAPAAADSSMRQRASRLARRSPERGREAVCDPIWTSQGTRDVARRLPEIDQSVLGFEVSESRKLLLLGWEEMLRQEAKLGNAEAVESLLFEKMFDINGACGVTLKSRI